MRMNNTTQTENCSLEEIAQQIQAVQDIALISHTVPDADTLGTCFGLKYALTKLGKSVTLYTDAALPQYLSFLFSDYVVYSEVKAHPLCISIDCGDLERIGARSDLLSAAACSINIDHHPTNTRYAKLNYVDAKAAATGEIIYALIKMLHVAFDLQLATCIYTALTGDTGSFRYSNTTPETMRIAAEMLTYGVDTWKINKSVFEDMSLPEVRLRGELARSIQSYANGKVCAVMLTEQMCSREGIAITDMDHIVDIPRTVQGCEVSASFKESGEKIKVSLRSNAYVDVSQIAMQFGGGGHRRAAGFSVSGTMEEVVERVISQVLESIKED